MRINLSAILLSSIAVLSMTGCSKFLKQESENLTPFANQTISMISTLDYGLSDNEYLYLRKIEDYIDEDKPFERFTALENQTGNQLKAMVIYSIQMVTISEQPISENEKSKKLADILVRLGELVDKDRVIQADKSGNTDAVLEEVRNSEDYLESLRILLPEINNFTAHALIVVDELEKEKRHMATLLENAVDNKYGAVIAVEHEMREVKNSYYHTAIALSRYADSRDVKYIEEMRTYGVLPVVDALRGKKTLTNKEVLKIHSIITSRMAEVNENYTFIKPDYDEYFASHQELRNILESKGQAIKEARLAFIIWGRAYQKMALGRTDPAEWFDVSESGTLLMGVAGRAVGI